ncbi:hypothetical protein L3Y34_010683 [Caenorhabditis briggsae]|uniref:Uncharacterized protein n=1 Tax=Caenorhabditis briggsae TaxID=6238 RepID=A0AAE9CSZ0_CAEBR|nr:hypothetical protein L3Y34_010683 [Caenorhabditis briggsae]
MQDKQDLHLVYNGSDNQVVQFNKQQTGLERIFASEMTHDIHFCRLIRKLETVIFEVTIYGKNKKEGDFKLIIQPAKTKKTDNGSILTTQHVLEPPSVWVGNPHRGIFTFMMKLEKGETNWKNAVQNYHCFPEASASVPAVNRHESTEKHSQNECYSSLVLLEIWQTMTALDRFFPGNFSWKLTLNAAFTKALG